MQVAASMQKEADFVPNYPNLPSKLICMLHNVTLHVREFCTPIFSFYSYEEKVLSCWLNCYWLEEQRGKMNYYWSIPVDYLCTNILGCQYQCVQFSQPFLFAVFSQYLWINALWALPPVASLTASGHGRHWKTVNEYLQHFFEVDYLFIYVIAFLWNRPIQRQMRFMHKWHSSQ